MKFLYEENNIIYASCDNCGRVLKFKKYEIADVKTGVECFCGNISDNISGLPTEKSSFSRQDNNPNHIIYQQSANSSNQPHCPTCGSTNIEKISLTSKAVGGAMFGIFSSNIRNSFKCKNCGYKW